MAYCEISNDDEAEAKQVLGETAKPTGRVRWWQGVKMPAVLQSEWTNDLGAVQLWFDVPNVRHYE